MLCQRVAKSRPNRRLILDDLPGSLIPGRRDQARPAMEAQIGPGPLQRDPQPVLEADQEKDVDTEPDEPGAETSQPESLDIGDGPVAADRGQIAFVLIVEGFARLPGKPESNVGPCPPALLHGDL